MAHVITWEFEVPNDNSYYGIIGPHTKKILRAEIHARGAIINRAFELQGGKIGYELNVEEVAPGRRVEEATDSDGFLVVQVSPMQTTDSVYGIDDYTDLETVIHEMEIRLSQNARILDKHADPSMAGPESVLDQDVRTGRQRMEAGKFFPVGEGETTPSYITWDGNLQASFQQIDKLVEMLYVISETSPAAFGKLDSGLAQSGSAMKRLLMAPLLKAQRIQGKLDPALTDVMGTAMKLEGHEMPHPVRIEWKDGLPKDFVELANSEAVRIGAGLSSVRSSLRRIDDSTEVELDEEMAAIKADGEQKLEMAAKAAAAGAPQGQALAGPAGGAGAVKLPGQKTPAPGSGTKSGGAANTGYTG